MWQLMLDVDKCVSNPMIAPNGPGSPRTIQGFRENVSLDLRPQPAPKMTTVQYLELETVNIEISIKATWYSKLNFRCMY